MMAPVKEKFRPSLYLTAQHLSTQIDNGLD